MNALKQQLLSGWNLFRIIRLALGIGALVFAVQTRDWAIGAASGLFVFMAISNTGCCGANGCATPYRFPLNEAKHEDKGIEEIK